MNANKYNIKQIKYIITSQHPDDWDEGIYEDHSFNNKEEAINFFNINYINNPICNEDINWYLVCVEESNIAEIINVDDESENLCDSLEIPKFVYDNYIGIIRSHFEKMKYDLINLNYLRYDLYPNYKDAIILSFHEEEVEGDKINS